MTITEMIKALTGAIDDIGSVIEDLKDAQNGDMDMEDVNLVYADQAARVVREVTAAIKAA